MAYFIIRYLDWISLFTLNQTCHHSNDSTNWIAIFLPHLVIIANFRKWIQKRSLCDTFKTTFRKLRRIFGMTVQFLDFFIKIPINKSFVNNKPINRDKFVKSIHLIKSVSKWFAQSVKAMSNDHSVTESVPLFQNYMIESPSLWTTIDAIHRKYVNVAQSAHTHTHTTVRRDIVSASL